MNASRFLFSVGLMTAVFSLISHSPVSKQVTRFPVVIIALEFPLTSQNTLAGQPNPMAEHREFPLSITQMQTDQYGTRRIFNNVVTDHIFGTTNSVADYFSKNSYGNFTLESAGIFGPYQASKSANHYWEEGCIECKKDCDKDCEDKDKDSWTDGHGERRSEAIKLFIAEEIDKRKSFNLAKYDSNNDGKVTKDELAVVVVCPQQNSYGVARGVRISQDSDDPFKVGNLDWVLYSDDDDVVEMFTFDFGGNRDLGLLAHELSHTIINAGDMYESINTVPNAVPPGWDPTRPGPYSLMDSDKDHAHLDPLHKIHAANWVSPIIVNNDGYYNIRAVEDFPDIYKLADPNSHQGEYFLVENRQPINYDNQLPGAGLAIWHIDESRLDNWRTAVEMEPASGPTNPIQWNGYLWSGFAREFSDDGLSLDSRWHDLSRSYTGVWAISQSSSTMRAYFDVPGPGILIQVMPELLQVNPGSTVNYNIRLVNTGPVEDHFLLTFAGIEEDWISLTKGNLPLPDDQPIEIHSYEDLRSISLAVTPPQCTKEHTAFFSVKATSATNPKISTTVPVQLVIYATDQKLASDPFEINNSFTGSALLSPVSSTSPVMEHLTLHDENDMDFFRIEFVGNPEDECFIKGSLMSLATFGPQYTPGVLSILLKEEYCRPMDIEIYYSNGNIYKTLHTEDGVRLDCPSAIFKDKKLVLGVRNYQKRPMRYILTVSYAYGYVTLEPPLVHIGQIKQPLLPDPPFLKFFDPATKHHNFVQLASDLESYLPRYNEYRSKFEKAVLDHGMGQLAHMAGRYDDAGRWYEQSLASFIELENKLMEAEVSRSRGVLFGDQGRDADAQVFFHRASDLHESLNDDLRLSYDRMAFGHYYMAKGENIKALDELDGALDIQDRIMDREGRFHNLLLQSRAFLELDRKEAAVACLMLAEELSGSLDDRDIHGALDKMIQVLKADSGEGVYMQLRERLAGKAEQTRKRAISNNERQ